MRQLPGACSAERPPSAHRQSVEGRRNLAVRGLVPGKRPACFHLKVAVRGPFNRNADTQDRSAFELRGRLIILAHGIGAVISDTETVAGECELAHLRTHWPFSNDFPVDVELRPAEGLTVLAGLLPDEFHPERVFARL